MTDSLSPEELHTAAKVNEAVARYLRLKYLTIIVLLAVLSPLAGFCLGLLLEGRLLDAAANRVIDSASTRVAESTAKAEKALERANKLTEELSGMKVALEYIAPGSSDLASLQESRDELEERLSSAKEQLALFDELLDDVDAETLEESIARVRAIEEQVRGISAVFEEAKNAQALSGAFYRVDELHISPLEVQLTQSSESFGPGNYDSIAALVPLTAEGAPGAGTFPVVVRLRKSGQKGRRELDWPQLSAMVTVNDEKKSTITLKVELVNQPTWWTVGDASKSFDIRTLAEVNEIIIEFKADAAVIAAAGAQLTGFGTGEPDGQTWRVDGVSASAAVNANREQFQVTTPDSAYALVRRVATSTLSLTIIDDGPLFSGAMSRYVDALASDDDMSLPR